MANWEQFKSDKYCDFTFICSDGELHYVKRVLIDYEYFAAMFRINDVESTTIEAPMEIVGRIILCFHTYEENDKMNMIDINLDTLKIAHLWQIMPILKYYYQYIIDYPKPQYLEWDIYFPWNKFKRFVAKLTLSLSLYFVFPNHYQEKIVDIYSECLTIDSSQFRTLDSIKSHGLCISNSDIIELVVKNIDSRYEKINNEHSQYTKDQLSKILCTDIVLILNLYNKDDQYDFNSRLLKILYTLIFRNI